jgi:FkbM family methyltransferase
MALRIHLAQYLRVAARYLEKPNTLAMRRRYFLPQFYNALDQSWVRALHIATILDIGGHVGEFAFTVRPLFPQAQIYSFEPLPDCCTQMKQHLAGAANFEAFNLGLGDQASEMAFHRSQFSAASSFLKMADAHKAAFPNSAESQEVKVRIDRLDTFAQRLKIVPPLLVKIDVQGYEAHVLRGGAQIISQAKVVIIETSFVILYAGQPLFADIWRTLTDWGFTYYGALDQSPGTNGLPLWQDSIFIR